MPPVGRSKTSRPSADRLKACSSASDRTWLSPVLAETTSPVFGSTTIFNPETSTSTGAAPDGDLSGLSPSGDETAVTGAVRHTATIKKGRIRNEIGEFDGFVMQLLLGDHRINIAGNQHIRDIANTYMVLGTQEEATPHS